MEKESNIFSSGTSVRESSEARFRLSVCPIHTLENGADSKYRTLTGSPKLEVELSAWLYGHQ